MCLDRQITKIDEMVRREDCEFKMVFLGQRGGLPSVDLQCVQSGRSLRTIINPKPIDSSSHISSSFRFIKAANADELRHTLLGKCTVCARVRVTTHCARTHACWIIFYRIYLVEQPAWAHEYCCNMPTILTYIDTHRGKLFVRRKNDEGDQRKMLDDLERYYFTLRHDDLKPERVELGDTVVVKVYRTQEWHRARILSELDHAKLGASYKVILLDRVRESEGQGQILIFYSGPLHSDSKE